MTSTTDYGESERTCKSQLSGQREFSDKPGLNGPTSGLFSPAHKLLTTFLTTFAWSA